MSSQACVDSNVVLKLAVIEDGSDHARKLWRRWRAEGVEKVAPALLWYELTSTMRNRVHRNSIDPDEATILLDTLLNLPIFVISSSRLHRAGWEIATRLNRPNAYDSHYLAVAEELDCPMWTADERFYNAAKGMFPRVHLLTSA